MITEDYCDFETAKLLKEKGFDERNCNTCYKYNGKFCNNRKSMSGVDTMISFPAPTLQMAMKWLREVKNIQIEISIIGEENDNHEVVKWLYGWRIQNSTTIDRHMANFINYEEAVEAALKYSLEKLI